MFPTLKLFVIYLIIPSLIGEETTKTPTSGELVEKEFVPITGTFKKIVKSLTDDELKYELGQVQGMIRKIIERAVKGDGLLKEQGAEENQNKVFRKMFRLLGVRSRAETLVDDLYPTKRPINIGVAKAYDEILNSDKPEFKDRACIKVFRQRVSSYGVSNADFVEGIRSIYASFSDKAAHKMSAFDPSPPVYNDKEGIEQMFRDFGFSADDLKVKTAQIILQPMPYPYVYEK